MCKLVNSNNENVKDNLDGAARIKKRLPFQRREKGLMEVAGEELNHQYRAEATR